MMVLEGEQGTGKSSAVEILAGEELLSDAEILAQERPRGQELTTGVWIYEISELEGIDKRDVAHVKVFASRKFDQRAGIGSASLRIVGRTCVFIGTTNRNDYLSDDTGNRRFWPVSTGKIDLDALRRDRDQLWAEAVVAEKTGEN